MTDTNKKILILGKGLAGSAFQRLFAEKGFTNVTAVNSQDVDLTNSEATMNYFQQHRPDMVVNCAGKVGGIIANRDFPADFIVTNLSIQLNVIQAAKAVNVSRTLFFASSCMYPKITPQPMSEEVLFSGKPEETSMAYAISKMAGMQLCLAFNQQFGKKQFIPVIPNSIYGPNDNFDPNSGHVLSALIRRFHEAKTKNIPSVTLWGTGSSRREFIHADDVANACFGLLFNDIEALELPVNIGVGSDLSIKELAEKIAETTEYKGEILWDTTKPDGAPQKLLNSARLNATGWKAEMPFDKGIAETYQWYKTHIAAQ